jgi:hypothetical protein
VKNGKAMNSVFSLLAKQPPKTFKVSYAPQYKNFIINHVATDPSHPLHETQRRRQAEKKKEGLWWHATTGVDLNKSSCVRAWARRRLRRAVVDELKARGYDENGKYANLNKLQTQTQTDLMAGVAAGKTLDLKGSLRLHVQAPLLPAKYVDVRAEAGAVIDAVRYGIPKDASVDYASAKPTRGRSSSSPPAAAQPSPFRVTKHTVKSRTR